LPPFSCNNVDIIANGVLNEADKALGHPRIYSQKLRLSYRLPICEYLQYFQFAFTSSVYIPFPLFYWMTGFPFINFTYQSASAHQLELEVSEKKSSPMGARTLLSRIVVELISHISKTFSEYNDTTEVEGII